MKRAQGLTLIELLTAVAVLGVVAVLAAPGFGAALANARRTRAVNDLVHAMHVARSAAATTGVPATLCAGTGGCSGSRDWSDGWLLFLNTDRDDPPALDPGERVLLREAADAGLLRRANRAAFVFAPTGRSGTTGTLVVCDRGQRVTPRAVIVSRTGRPRAAALDASGRALSCP
jgi:type IV fimbrial biogenesis protein FimT